MHDSYDIADLCRELEAERKAVAVRSGVFTLFLGGAYLLVGCFVWEQMVAAVAAGAAGDRIPDRSRRMAVPAGGV